MANVSIPILLRNLTGGTGKAVVAGATLKEIVAGLEVLYPGIEARLRNGDRINPIVSITVDGQIAQGLDAPVRPDSDVCILPRFGGG